MDGSNLLAETSLQGRPLKLARSAQPTRTGLPYFELVYEAASRPSVYRIWANELIWFTTALSKAVAGGFRSGAMPGSSHALAFDPTGSGGQSIWLTVDGEDPRLIVRRYQNSRQGADDGQNHFTRYLTFDRSGQIQFPMAQDALSAFCAQARESLHRNASQILDAIGLPSNSFDAAGLGVFQSLSAAILAGQRTLVLPGQELDATHSHWPLAKPAQLMALEAASGKKTFAEVEASLEHILDQRTLKSLLDWPRRYAREVLGFGFVLNQHDPITISSVRATKAFASDPLLTSLDLKPPTSKPAKGTWARIPQGPAQILDKVMKEPDCCSGVTSTPMGDVPIPSNTMRREILGLLAPAAGLRMYRWKILQFLEFWSAAACNLPGGIHEDPVFELQRLALLEGDVRALFQNEEELVEAVLTKAQERRASLLNLAPGFEPYQPLPKR